MYEKNHSTVQCATASFGGCLAGGNQQNNSINFLSKSQDLPFSWDSTDSEILSKFQPKKATSLLLSESFGRLGLRGRSDRVSLCGTQLEFAYEISPDGVVSDSGKLHSANFCRDRLCPMCSWRRSYKIFGQVSSIMDVIEKDYTFLFLTLTVPSVPGDELSSTLDRMFESFRRLIHFKAFKNSVRGFFRALEVTRNNNRGSKSYGLFHPHFHIILAVPKGYFNPRFYISHSEWLSMWRKAYRDNSITQVDIRKCKPKVSASGSEFGSESFSDGAAAAVSLAAAVAETAKYSVKSSDYIFPDDSQKTDEIVSVFASALHSRRLASFGGVFKEILAKLNLDDCEDGDLVHINDDVINPDLALLIVKYGWSTGVYKMTDIFFEMKG